MVGLARQQPGAAPAGSAGAEGRGQHPAGLALAAVLAGESPGLLGAISLGIPPQVPLATWLEAAGRYWTTQILEDQSNERYWSAGSTDAATSSGASRLLACVTPHDPPQSVLQVIQVHKKAQKRPQMM